MKAVLSNFKKAMTLVELLVSLGIMSIVMIGLTLFFAYMWRTRFDEIYKGQSMITSSQSVSSMAENIRRAAQADSGSYAIASANDFEMIFYSDIDGDQNREKIHYYIDGSSIMMGIAEPILGDTPTYPDIDEETRLVAKNVVNDSESEPIFTYYNLAGEELETPAPISRIKKVRIYVSVNSKPNRITNTVIQTLVSPRNINK